MAGEKRVILLKTDIDNTSAIKANAELLVSIEKLKKTNRELKKSFGDNTAESKKNAQAYAENDGKLKSLQEDSRKYTKILKDNTKEQKANQTIVTKTNGSINSLGNALNINKDAYRSLTKTERENTAQGKRLNATIQKQDAAYKRLNRTIGNSQSNVGNYATGIRNLASQMGLFLGVAGAFRLLKNIVGTVREFGASMQTLAGVFRTSREDLSGVEAEIKRVGSTSVKSANDIAKLAESLATLGKSKEEVIALLEPVTRLSIGLKANADEAGEFLVQMLNTFGGSSDEAESYANTIATIRTSTSLDFEKMRDSFQFLAPISKVLGKDLAYTGSLVGLLADNGIKASRAGRLLGTSQQKLAKDGNTLDSALEKINKSQANGIEGNELLSIATGLFGKQAAGLGIILANNTGIVEENAQAIRDNGGALDDLVNSELQSLDSQLKILSSSWTDYILSINESSGASNGLTNVIKFLSKNLSTILNLLGFLVTSWLAYKTVVFASSVATGIATAAINLKRVALVLMRRGLISTIKTLNLFKSAMAKTGIGALVVGVGALVYQLTKASKSSAELTDEIIKNSNETSKNYRSTLDLSDELETLSKRYDELTKNGIPKNVKEQKELKTIIDKIAKAVPDAVTEFDEYGKALTINTDKIKEFNKLAEGSAKADALVDLNNAKEQLAVLSKEYDVRQKIKETGESDGKDRFNIEPFNAALKFQKNGALIFANNVQLSAEQNKIAQKYLLTQNKSITTLKNTVKINADIISGQKKIDDDKVKASNKLAKDSLKLVADQEKANKITENKTKENEKASANKLAKTKIELNLSRKVSDFKNSLILDDNERELAENKSKHKRLREDALLNVKLTNDQKKQYVKLFDDQEIEAIKKINTKKEQLLQTEENKEIAKMNKQFETLQRLRNSDIENQILNLQKKFEKETDLIVDNNELEKALFTKLQSDIDAIRSASENEVSKTKLDKLILEGNDELAIQLAHLDEQEQIELLQAEELGVSKEIIEEKFRQRKKDAEALAIAQQIEEVIKYANAVNGIFTALQQASQQKNDQELASLEEKNKSGVLSDKDYATKKAEIEIKIFKQKKKLALIGAIIDTAGAIAKALPNVILAGLAAVAGGIQIGTIASSQPPALPGFADGSTSVTPLGFADYTNHTGTVTGSGNISPLANGDNMLATIKTGEAILNDKQQGRLNNLLGFDAIKYAVKGYADGTTFTGAAQTGAINNNVINNSSINNNSRNDENITYIVDVKDVARGLEDYSLKITDATI
jgi:hypothetical protein